MKRSTTLLLLLFALVAGLAAAQPEALPADERFDQRVEFSTGPEGESLSAMLAALARSVGLTPILDGVPQGTTITYDIGDPKPFRQVWDLVLTLNDLDYELQENDVVVVGTPEALAPLRSRRVSAEPTGSDQAEADQRFYRLNTDADAMIGILRTAMPGLDVSRLTDTTLVVTAGEDRHARVRELLSEFDVRPEQTQIQLEQRVYQLSNATASELAAVLQGSDIVVGGALAGEGEGAAAPGERGFTVVADERTNSVIVTATPAVQARIAELIPQLDQPQTQVNVQVRIQEINRRTASNLGINLAAAGGNFAANLLGGGLEFVFDAQAAVTGLNLSAVLDTLESQGLSRRVDDSSLTVLNNGTGRMQSGGRIEIQFPSGDGELATRTIEFGVIIEVAPRIAADGRVILDVTAEVSDVLVPISEGGIPERIDFSTREVTSTVTLRPGQTVLLGGLLQNSFTQSESRVPILGSIPIIGSLFGTTIVEDENTELLLVVNAQVID